MRFKNFKDSILGCLVGGAIGDYVGSCVEGREGPIEVQITMDSAVSDDTQLTLATCESVVKAGDVDPVAIAASFADWFQQGRITGIGSSTLKAMRDLSFGAHWAFAGARGERAAGNGAAMRIAPLAFCVDPFSIEGQQMIRDVSAITHKNDEAMAGALAVVIAVAAETFDFVPQVIDELWDSNTRDRLIALHVLDDVDLFGLAQQFGSSGYVADSVPLSLIAASRAQEQTFGEAVCGIISCGGDVDTMGSMVGQIVGSKVGLSGIPANLVKLPFGEPVMSIANAFAEVVVS